MPIQVTRYVEHLIESYPKTIQFLKKFQESLHAKRSNYQFDSFVSPIDEEMRIERLETIVNAIKRALTYFSNIDNKAYLKFIELKYWNKYEELNMNGISMRIHVSRRTAYNMKDQIVYRVAKELGEWI